MAVETQVSEPAMVPKKRRVGKNKAFKGKKKPKTMMLDCIAQNKPKKIDRKMKKLFRKRARDYNSDNDERDVGSDGESEKEEEEVEDMDVNGDNGVSDDEENGEIQPGITMFLEGSRAFKMAFKSTIKKCLPEDALVGEKGHVKPANYLDSYEKFLIGVATKGGTVFMYVNEAQHAQKGLDPLRYKDAKCMLIP
ncbi:hypothetical protein CFP56_035432 [Quercus suber]|uniref:Uncharacterized protein n=1 Tax=Quercus suber TaxID=58331 RepID=A0AAW0J9N0_QUESU